MHIAINLISLKLIDTLRLKFTQQSYVRECQVINRKEEEKKYVYNESVGNPNSQL